MPYSCTLEGSRWKLTKKGSSDSLGSHRTKHECMSQMRAIYSNEKKKPTNFVFDGTIYNNEMIDYRISQITDNEINLVINSKGGSFLDSISLHNKFRSAGKKIICYIDPFAFSAAATLALAGDEIYMVENGMMMFHPPMLPPGDEAKNAEQTEKDAVWLRKAEEILVNTLMSKTLLSKEECEKIIKNETWLTAEEALKMGIVNDIIPINRDVTVENYFPLKAINFLEEKKKMPLKEVCERLGLADQTEDGLIKYIDTLKNSQPKPPVEYSDAIINSVKSAREIQLDSLVNNGKATPAVVIELKTKYLEPTRIKTDLQNNSSEFDAVVSSHAKNEEIISFKGKSGTQPLPKGREGEEEDKVLVNDMEKRKKALQRS